MRLTPHTYPRFTPHLSMIKCLKVALSLSNHWSRGHASKHLRGYFGALGWVLKFRVKMFVELGSLCLGCVHLFSLSLGSLCTRCRVIKSRVFAVVFCNLKKYNFLAIIFLCLTFCLTSQLHAHFPKLSSLNWCQLKIITQALT